MSFRALLRGRARIPNQPLRQIRQTDGAGRPDVCDHPEKPWQALESLEPRVLLSGTVEGAALDEVNTDGIVLTVIESSVLASHSPAINATAADPVVILSPNGQVEANVYVDETGRLVYTLANGSTSVLEPSPLGISVDGADLGQGVTVGATQTSTINETYPWRGQKSVAVNHATVTLISITHAASGTTWTLETRAYDDGFAFRYVVPGTGTRRVNGEATAWVIPDGSDVWYQTDIQAYEGHYQQSAITALNEPEIGMPVTIELAGGAYAAIMESDLLGYSGMSLTSSGNRQLQGVFADNAGGWDMTGEISSAWRITMTGDLNTLVNSDIVHNVAPPPDPTLFPDGFDTDWIEPGRTLWTWWDLGRGGAEWSLQKGFVDDAAELNFQYYLVDAGWEDPVWGWMDENGDPWAKLAELTAYAEAQNVGIWVWRDWDFLDTPEKRTEFYGHIQAAGVKGVKIDHMNSESQQMLEFYEANALAAAQHQIMLNWHGSNKPAGEARFWPHEMTREGIRGLEHNKFGGVQVDHYAALPFTRYLAGHGDFTPTTFKGDNRWRRGTTHALQLSSAMLYDSPLLVWADHPDQYLNSSAVDLVKNMPFIWDETIVLPQSDIGELVVMAKRSGANWYLGVINGNKDLQKEITVDLSFLGDNITYDSTLVRDNMSTTYQFTVENGGTAQQSDQLTIQMKGGGGFLGRFVDPDFNDPPQADAGPNRSVHDADNSGAEPVTLDGTGSSDPDSPIVSYIWTEGGVEIATRANPTIDLAVGDHTIVLEVTDDEGKTDTDVVEITVFQTDAPVADAGPDQVVTASNTNPTLLSVSAIEAFHQGDNLTGSGSILKAIDGSGMSQPDANDPSTWTINSTAWQNDWQGQDTPDATQTTWVVIDLGSPRAELKSMYLWNVQEGGQTDRGMQNFDVYFAATDVGMSSLNPAVPATDSNTQTAYDFNANPTSWTFLDSFVLPQGTGNGDSGAVFDVSGAAGARYIAFDINSNYGDNGRVGFAEVAFTDTAANGLISLDGSGSFDPDGAIVSYVWTENGEEIATGVSPQLSLDEGVHILTLTVTDDLGVTDTDTVTITVLSEGSTAVVGRHVFYNNSKFDDNDPAANADDDSAIAPDKSALLPGGTATFANYTSYDKGINGIMLDIAGLSGTPTAADFAFKTGNTDDPSSWTDYTGGVQVSVRAGAGVDGTDRVTLIFPDGQITKTWLEVTVLSDANGGGLGLATDEVFYFGNAIAESGNSASDALVNLADVIRTRNNQTGFGSADIDNVYDNNRDGLVNLWDVIRCRNHLSGFTPLNLIDLSSSAPLAPVQSVEPASGPAIWTAGLTHTTRPGLFDTADDDSADEPSDLLMVDLLTL